MKLVVAAVLALVLPLPAPPLGSDVPDDCTLEPTLVSCRWEFSTDGMAIEGASPVGPLTFELPVFERTIGVFVVNAIGKDNGWTLSVERRDEAGNWQTHSRSVHPAQNDLSYRHSETSAHVIFAREGEDYRVAFSPYPEQAAPIDPPAASVGRSSITYAGSLVPEGVAPSRPAATLADPQLLDTARDVEPAEYDILAAWFDDARVGDGLMDVHVRLAALSPEVPLADALGLGADKVGWKVAWSLSGARYQVEWWVDEHAQNSTRLQRRGVGTSFGCVLRTDTDAGSSATDRDLAYPACVFDFGNATLHATFPERSIGSPLDGLTFERPAARTRVYAAGRPEPDVVDETDDVRYLFALGGPDVWSVQNARLDPPPSLWYRDPLAPQNVADTFQVAGTLAALATFLGGLALVWRNRRQTSALLARIDALAEQGVDQSETLRALGRLEAEFATMYRRHRISESQYQVLSQRIATVATRFALRRSLGLDDGVPGDAGPTRSVPVMGPDETRRRN